MELSLYIPTILGMMVIKMEMRINCRRGVCLDNQNKRWVFDELFQENNFIEEVKKDLKRERKRFLGFFRNDGGETNE